MNGIALHLQHPQPVQYKDVRIDCGSRIDILVEYELIAEIRCVAEAKGIHEATLLTYVKLSGVKSGLPINFPMITLKDGIKRFAF